MATDTVRAKLELASGKSEITAPFHQTAERKRNDPEDSTSSDASVIIDVPLAGAASFPVATISESTAVKKRPGIAQPTWIAFIAALLLVAVAVWWVMFQRLPQIDPQAVIERNLGAAQQAMADGRYTDPYERSAFHYYNTVLALDPQNGRAIAGIDAIADRHLTDARVLLADQRIAEAGVALEKARRVRPDHSGLAALDGQLRAELRKILASSTALNSAPVGKLEKKSLAKGPANGSIGRSRAANIPPAAPVTNDIPPSTALDQKPEVEATSSQEANASLTAAASSREVTNAVDEPAAASSVASESVALSAAQQASTLELAKPAIDEVKPNDNAPGAGANVGERAVGTTSALPEHAPATAQSTPKLVKMVQPEYPQEASIRGIEGWVDVSLEVSAAGDVVDPRIEATSRGRLFNRAALAAVQQWKYQPRDDATSAERIRVRLQFQKSK